MRYSAVSRKEFPAVAMGDHNPYGPDQAIKGIPQKSCLPGRLSGKGEIQIISSNIDCAFIVPAISNNFNINRLNAT
jgi:hypothetical protein